MALVLPVLKDTQCASIEDMKMRSLCGLLCVLVCCVGCESEAMRARMLAEKAELEARKVVADEQAMELQRAAETVVATGAKVERANSGEVTSIDLRGVEVTDTLASEVSKLIKLSKLTLSDSAMTVAGWRELGKLNALQQLDVRDCPLNNEQLAAVVAGLPQLKALRMSGKSGRTKVDDSGLSVLSKCPELKALAIDGLWVTIEGIKLLSQNKKLVELYAGDTAVDDEAAALIAKLPALRKVRLSRTGIGTAGIEALSVLPLEDLDISESSGIGDDSLAIIGKMKSLKRLNLWRDTVGDLGVQHLAGLTELDWLNLDNTHLADAGLKHLSGMTKLTFLHIGSTGVTDAGMPALGALKSLKDLKVTRTAVTEAGADVVRKAIPSVKIQLEYIEGE